jgi:hypothetical protein
VAPDSAESPCDGAPSAPPAPFRLALWSDGTLEIYRGDKGLIFSSDETQAIVRYLDRLAVQGATQS